jgi:hypothetical protein
MKKSNSQVTERETRFIEQLRDHPELMERFEEILGLAQSDGEIKRADDVEDLVVEGVRRLGRTTMKEWAKKAEAKVAADYREKHPTSHVAKKKS